MDTEIATQLRELKEENLRLRKLMQKDTIELARFKENILNFKNALNKALTTLDAGVKDE